MATRLKPTEIQRCGEIPAGGLLPLSFVVLLNGEILIDRGSLLRYLEIDTNSPLLTYGTLPATVCHVYISGDHTEQLGVSLLEVPAFCINVLEQHTKTGQFPSEALNAMMLMMFFTASGINGLIRPTAVVPDETPVVPMPFRPGQALTRSGQAFS